MEEKVVNMMTNPDTGEQVIIGEATDFDKSFDDMVNKINSGDDVLSSAKPLSETDVIEYMANEDSDELLSTLSPDTGLTNDDIRVILKISNKIIKREPVNVYKELPESVKKSVDTYVSAIGTIGTTAQINQVRNNISRSIINEFIDNIQLSKAKSDFATELQRIYESSAKDLSDAGIEMIDERNKVYREAADNIEDEDKRNKLKAILDRIDEARDLSELKVYAKSSKIKSIELEKPENRVYSSFVNKYVNSSNNIYDINLAKKILYRHLSQEGYSEADIDVFFITFCKQAKNYSVDNPLEHAYMYYVLYYCAMLDSDKSDTFKNNVKEVISIAKARNNIIDK